MTLAQIAAIISLLLSFGVDPKVAEDIRVLISPSYASSTPAVIVPVVQTPVVANTPVYFGSVNPTPVVVPPEVKKDLRIDTDLYVDDRFPHGLRIVLRIRYTEDGKDISDVPVTVSAPKGTFSLKETKREITALTKYKKDIEQGVELNYFVEDSDYVTITAVANGVTAEKRVGSGPFYTK